MKVLVVSDHARRGGAAIAGHRLARAMQSQGHQVHFTAVHDDGDGDVEPIPLPSLRRGASIAPAALALPAAARLRRWVRRCEPDVVHVHNIHGARHRGLSTLALAAVAERTPVVWTLHDMWSLTGRCSYPGDCRRYASQCTTSCPTAHAYPDLRPQLIPLAHVEKKTLIRRGRLVAVAPSGWLADEARHGPWASQQVHHIRNGLPLDVFHPRRRSTARLRLGVDPSPHPLLCFAAADLDDPRKGMQLLLDALHLVERPVRVLLIGQRRRLPQLPNHVKLVASLTPSTEDERADAFAAADVTVHAALEDNLPNTIAESLCVGTPVVGFAIGGVREMLSAPDAGWLASSVSSRALADALRVACDPAHRPSPDDVAASAHARYDAVAQAAEYVALFEQLRRASTSRKGLGR